MATKPIASIARIQAANNNAYDASANPGGLAQGGHRTNFVLDLQASIDVALWAEALALEIADDVAAVEAAYDAIQAGPVVSVVGQTGVVTAAQIKAALTIAKEDVAGLVTALGLLAAKTDLPVKATGGEVAGGTVDTKFATPKALIDAMVYVPFSASAINLGNFINGKVTLTANTTFAAPTNAKEGASGILAITQDATGGRTGSWNTFWDFGKVGVPTLSTAAGAVDYVSYAIAQGATKAICTFWQSA